MSTSTFVVERKNLRQRHWLSREPAPLTDGEVRLRIDRFALTANNITYAAFGETMNYWAFFPTGSAHTGCIPVWGFADVSESRADGVAAGERVVTVSTIAVRRFRAARSAVMSMNQSTAPLILRSTVRYGRICIR